MSLATSESAYCVTRKPGATRRPRPSTGTRSAAKAHEAASRRRQQPTERSVELRAEERGFGRAPRQDVVGARGLLSTRAIVSHSGNENRLRAWQSKSFFRRPDASVSRMDFAEPPT